MSEKTYKITCKDCGKYYWADNRRNQRIAILLKTDPDYLNNYICKDCRAGISKQEPSWNPIKLSKRHSKKTVKSSLVGYNKILQRIVNILKYGTKAVILGGYHGLGKTTMAYDIAEFFGAEVIRLQVTEMLSDIDIVGGVDPVSGKFLESDFVKKVRDAIENPKKKYLLLIDEFTRGREEAMEIFFPVFAERLLVINSPYAENKEIMITDNIMVMATGNIHDRGVREVGGAEFDRFNGVEIEPLKSKTVLRQMLKKCTKLKDSHIISNLLDFYLLSWEYGSEARILPMSHRTLIEVGNVCAGKIKDGFDTEDVLEHTLEETYFVSSQAMLNPNFKNTYKQMVREVL